MLEEERSAAVRVRLCAVCFSSARGGRDADAFCRAVQSGPDTQRAPAAATCAVRKAEAREAGELGAVRGRGAALRSAAPRTRGGDVVGPRSGRRNAGPVSPPRMGPQRIGFFRRRRGTAEARGVATERSDVRNDFCRVGGSGAASRLGLSQQFFFLGAPSGSWLWCSRAAALVFTAACRAAGTRLFSPGCATAGLRSSALLVVTR